MKYLLVAIILAALGQSAHADQTVTIGVLTDMSNLFKDISGPGSVLAGQMAVEDFEASNKGVKVRIISADTQNKPDIAAATARKWFDVDSVDMIVDAPNSSVALAVSEVARAKNKALFVSSSGSTELTGASCSPNTVHYTYDTYSTARIVANELVKKGRKSWFFITADYSFGHALERDATNAVKEGGGSVLGSVRAPINSPDFSSFLLQAQSSNASVVAFANAGADLNSSMKQAAEFGLDKGSQTLAGLLVTIADVKALGLSATQGLSFAEAFYWDLDEDTRAWSKRFALRNNGVMPTMGHAGVYSSVLAYLNAVKDSGQASDGSAVIRQLRSKPWVDPLFGKTSLRADGRVLHRMLFLEVKKPEQSKGPYDLLNVQRIIQPEDAFRPESEGDCPLSGKN
jgi:branched-chain amino acid transport system substrate-binding protein